jgi:hypothetical protein
MMCYFFNLIRKLINSFENKVWCGLVGGSDQRRLLKYLMTEKAYDPLERPVQNDSQSLPVTVNLALQQIINFVSENNIEYILHTI